MLWLAGARVAGRLAVALRLEEEEELRLEELRLEELRLELLDERLDRSVDRATRGMSP